MKVMLIGSGGREHCIAWKVMQNPEVKELYCVPGNGGMSSLGICYTLNTLQDMVQFAKEKEISLTLIGPEAPLAKGVVGTLFSQDLEIPDLFLRQESEDEFLVERYSNNFSKPLPPVS
jgi:phosphoribosylamine--glycine ligase